MNATRRITRLGAVFVSLVLASLALAGVTFYPHPGFPAPVYFSGSNSRAFYRAIVTAPHNHIAKMELYLNGVLTQTLNTPFLPGGGDPEYGTMGALVPVQESAIMFDSFTYQLGMSSIIVSCRVIAETHPGGAQQEYWHSYFAPAKNKNAIFSLQAFEDGTYPTGNGGTATWNCMTALGYPKSFTWALGWTGTDFETKLAEGVNAVSYVGHGNLDGVIDGCLPFHDIWFMTADGCPSIEAMRLAAVANNAPICPRPPFNPPGAPALNIVAAWSCTSFMGGTSKAGIYLWPYWNGYNVLLENQSYMGFSSTYLIADAHELADAYWGAMGSGFTAEESRVIMMDTPAGHHYQNNMSHIWGDTDARLICVYNPGNSAQLFWRNISMPSTT